MQMGPECGYSCSLCGYNGFEKYPASYRKVKLQEARDIYLSKDLG
jgi:hypothetical protein